MNRYKEMTRENIRIEEVTSITSQYMDGMIGIFNALFPGLHPSFREILSDRYDSDGNLKRQIFVGLSEDVPAGLLQVFYRPWRNGLVGEVDLVGVLESYRKTGLGLRMMRRAVTATEQAAGARNVPVHGLVWLTEPDKGHAHTWPVRRVRMYEKMGAQVRRDLIYRFDGQPEPDGEIILWCPLARGLGNVPTKELAWLLWQSGGLPEDEFVRRYGQPPHGN